MTRTFCFASSATVTLGVVDNGNVIYEMYRVVGTEFLANAATDTTRFTHIHNLSAFTLSAASDVNLCVFGNPFDEFFGTLCYILKDDYDTALETAKKAYDDNGNSLEVIDTLALCAVLKNDDATYSSMESLLDGSGYSLSDKVTGFKAGTVTLDDILLKGAYDVE